jgi:hypothetical protein
MQTQATTEIHRKSLSELKDFGMPQDWRRNFRSRILSLDFFDEIIKPSLNAANLAFMEFPTRYHQFKMV